VNLRMIEKVEPYFNGGLLLEIHGAIKLKWVADNIEA
jgi:hypothetical protein